MRNNRTRDEWNSISGAQARSSLSQNEFCPRRGITPQRFLTQTQNSVFLQARRINQPSFQCIYGLALIVEQEGTDSPFDQALFVFCNRNRGKVKALYSSKTGFCLWHKRLEKDFFYWPKGGQQAVQLTEEQWRWLLAGVDLDKMRPHPPVNCVITG